MEYGMPIAQTERVMKSGQAGMSLIELMVVVAIAGILATVAVVSYIKYTQRAKASEVHAMFAELRLHQEQYQAENGVYLSTGANEADYHPAAPSGPDAPNPVNPMPLDWTKLRMQPDKENLYCSYVSIAGPAAGGTIGPVANSFGMLAPPLTNWYYLIAECDLDGNPAVNSLYFNRSDVEGTLVQNKGH